MSMAFADEVVLVIDNLYRSLAPKPHPGQYTILASFVLSSSLSRLNAFKVISLSTGLKCLPVVRLPPGGDAVHDSHAEVLARRGAIRWFLEEVGRYNRNDQTSEWINLEDSDSGRIFSLKKGVDIHMYVSTLPCGDASTRYLASFQDEEMAALKDSTVYPKLSPDTAARGRDNYALYSVLRTKPGRADSPPTFCMSCSDKIATWNVLGFQGALASYIFRPLYISTIIIGEVPQGMQDDVREDCARAFWRRINGLQGLPSAFALCKPDIQFTSSPFLYSRTSLASTTSGPITPCNESLCWIADSIKPHDVLINGRKRGVPPKHQHKENFQPQLSKISLFKLFTQISELLEHPWKPTAQTTYFEAKQSITHYQAAKRVLMGDGAPFSGWIRTGFRWENFDLNGEYRGERNRDFQDIT